MMNDTDCVWTDGRNEYELSLDRALERPFRRYGTIRRSLYVGTLFVRTDCRIEAGTLEYYSRALQYY